VLGLEEGDAHVIRNAGGRTIEALRSIVISQQLLGTREIVIIHHVSTLSTEQPGGGSNILAS
jgi:carbonic anhydrase